MDRGRAIIITCALGLPIALFAGGCRQHVQDTPVDALSWKVVPPKPSAKCNIYDAAYEQAPLMQVVGRSGLKVYLQNEARPCPDGAACPWIRTGYVVPGDEVFASAPIDGFRCVYAGSHGRLSAGFVPESALRMGKEVQSITPDWLVGDWSDGVNLIEFALKDGKLLAVGDGVWPGREPVEGIQTRDGEFKASATATKDKFALADDGCRVEGRRRGSYLVVTDNQVCGGANVRFQGIYVSGSTLKPQRKSSAD